jgi:integrase/recombinase XerD
MESRFEQFIKSKLYLLGVTPRTVEWYRHSLRWLPSEQPTQTDLNDLVRHLQDTGHKPTGVNCVARCVNSYLHWNSGTDRKCGPGCTHPRIRPVREPKVVMPTFNEQQIKLLVQWKPKTKYHRRLHLLVLFLLDTGCRISEALTLRVSSIDMDNLLVTLDGKGRRQRIVPFSPELRRAMYRHAASLKLTPHDLLLGSRKGTEWARRNITRDVKRICRSLGFTAPARTLHAFRHSFAVSYLRRGGDVFRLQKTLGHSTLEMTRRYVNMTTDDLRETHARVSLLK